MARYTAAQLRALADLSAAMQHELAATLEARLARARLDRALHRLRGQGVSYRAAARAVLRVGERKISEADLRRTGDALRQRRRRSRCEP